MGEKNTIKISLSTFFLILCIIIIALMGYYIYNISQENIRISEDLDAMGQKVIESQEQILANNSIKTEATQSQKETKVNLNHFNPKKGKVVDENVTSYILENNSISGEMSVKVNSDNEVEFLLSSFAEGYLTEGAKRKGGHPEIIKGFSGKVDEVELGMLGQDISGGLILFLMEDGTVEYIGVNDALKTDNLSSRGKLESLKDIVRIESASVSYEDSGVLTMIAIDKDGNFYDIAKIIEQEKIDLQKVN